MTVFGLLSSSVLQCRSWLATMS